MGMIELRVIDDGQDVLVYTLQHVSDAAELMRFLADFLPEAKFLIQPLRH